ncbi:MAG: hypothetical protein SVO26_07380 [Chloroflexota bacterium]|nr:hypothetical protein [Chloroflexota bacterium]
MGSNECHNGRSVMRKSNNMKKPKFSLAHRDESIVELVSKTDHKILALWSIDCVERVLPYFEEKYPGDNRPRKAIEACREWVHTGIFKMKDVRTISLAAHAAAREVGEDNAARSAARAAGHAMATAHVATHSIGAANYALQAIYRAANPSDTDAAIARERDWQYHHLLELVKTYENEDRT